MGIAPDIMRWFEGKYLPPIQRETSNEFESMALKIAKLAVTSERSVSLRLLLDARNATLRAVILDAEGKGGTKVAKP